MTTVGNVTFNVSAGDANVTTDDINAVTLMLSKLNAINDIANMMSNNTLLHGLPVTVNLTHGSGPSAAGIDVPFDPNTHQITGVTINLNLDGISTLVYKDPAGNFIENGIYNHSDILASLANEIGNLAVIINPDLNVVAGVNPYYNLDASQIDATGRTNSELFSDNVENLIYEAEGKPDRKTFDPTNPNFNAETDTTEHVSDPSAPDPFLGAPNSSARLDWIVKNSHNHHLNPVAHPKIDWSKIQAPFLDPINQSAKWFKKLGDVIDGVPGSVLPPVLDNLKNLWDIATHTHSPLVLDLNGDGIHTTAFSNSNTSFFDLTGSGFAHQTGWVSSGDGLLCVDLNQNGKIDNGGELFGSASGGGFPSLAQYDTDGDGKVTANDANFSSLLVWEDFNGDGVSDWNEIFSLSQLGISSIDLNATSVNLTDNGNSITQTSTFTIDNGSGPVTQTIADVWFVDDPTVTRYAQDYTLDPLAVYLPGARGFGTLPDLHIAMSIDDNVSDPNSLISLVQTLSNKTFEDLFVADGSILQEVRQIMYRWAGVDDVNPTSRGPMVDGQELGFLEAYMGQGYISAWGLEDPNGNQAADSLIKAFGTVLDHVYAVLMAQTAASDLFTGDFFYNIATDQFEGITGLNLTRLNELETEASGLSGTAAKDLFWRDVVRLVEYSEGTGNLSGSDSSALDNAIHTTDSSLTLSGILTELVPGLYDGITVLGTTASETLTGGNNSDFLIGNGGNDTFLGNDGHDNMQGGAGNDTFTGGLGNDYSQGAAGNDVYKYNIGDGSDTIFDTAGIDKILLGAGIDYTNLTFSRASNNDLRISIDVGTVHGEIIISSQFVTANGSTSQIETIEFSDGSYINLTTLNHLQLDGTKYAEELDGLQVVGGQDDSINGNDGNDVVQGFDGNDTLHGNNGNDYVTGGNGTDTLYGDAGNDTLDGGAGNDTMAGGTGDDTYYVDSASDVVTENSGEGNDTIITALNNYTLPNYVENLTLTGSALIGNGNSLDNHLVGNNSNNTLIGGDGNDTLDGSFGADSMNGGLGNDTFIVDNTGDVVIEAASQGTDLVKSSVTFTLSSTQEIENLTLIGIGNINGTGNTLNNIITGNVGNNTLDGGTGADTLIGGGGNDTFVVDNAGDSVTGGSGVDTVSSSVSFTLSSELENLTLTGSTALVGTGNALANTITGNTGADTLVGGGGNDIYIITNAGTVITENTGGGTDTVQFGNTTAGTSYTLSNTQELENLTLTGTAAIKGVGNDLANVMNGNSGSNTLDGGNGNDTLWGGTAGTDSLIGGAGDDTFIVDRTSGITIVEGTSGGTDTEQASVTTTLAANVENLVLTGTSAINGTGTTGANVITGNIANNALSDGGAGSNDTLIGGAGDDTYTVNNTGDVIQEAASGGTDTVSSSVSFTLDNTQEIENLTLTGSSVLVGTGNDLANTITGNTGADTLVGGNGDDVYVITNASTVIIETSTGGNDTIMASGTSGTSFGMADYIENLTLTGSAVNKGVGNDLNNVMNGNSGSNTLDGGNGNDTLWGGTAGTDSLIGGAGDDTFIVDRTSGITIVEGASGGTDTVQASVTYTIGATSNIENLVLTGTGNINGTGNTLANVITGNSGNNALSDGGAGSNDTLIGGAGDDTFTVNNTGDVIQEATAGGTDTVSSSVSFTLDNTQEIENLTLTGSSVLVGTGNSLSNTITGNTGADTLIGGTGDDTYIITNASTTITENSNEGIDTVSASGTAGTVFTLAANVENITLTGSTAIHAVGNSLDNILTGNSGINSLTGGDGNDTYFVQTTTDVIVEGSGGSSGIDTVEVGVTYTLGANLENLVLTGASAINGTGNALVNVITGNGAANVLDGGAGADTLIGGAGNDTYTVDDAGDVITENSGEGTDLVNASVTYSIASFANVENLTLTGSANINATGNDIANVITGNTGNNVLDGGAGADSMIGGTGNDTYYVDNTGDVVTESSSLGGTDLVDSLVTFTLGTNVENLTLIGTDSVNGTGNTLVNIITGNSGDNTLNGGTGADTLIGGGGNDTFIVDSTLESVTAGSGVDTIQSSVTWTLASNVENLTFTGSTALVGTGNSLANTFTGNTGADTFIGGAGNDVYIITNASTVITENVGDGTDLVQFGSTTAGTTYTLASNVENLTLTGSAAINGTGNSGDNIITGNSGDNTLSGGGGTDSMIGGTGNDVYVVDSTSDVLTENLNEGTDTVQSSVNWTLGTFFENLTLTGGSVLNGTGNISANTITGNTAADTLSGGGGNDVYIITNASTSIVETSNNGTDTVQFGNTTAGTTFTLAANVENLTLTGTAAINGTGNSSNNVITGNSAVNTLDGGGSGNDYLSGGSGNDTLTGGTGNDTLDGGVGNDSMAGGAGNDTYYVDSTSDIVTETSGNGTDTVFFTVNTTGASYTLAADLENLTLTGNFTKGFGNASDNVITGGPGSSISGMDGNDILIDPGAGNGSCSMIGGNGNDTYMVNNSSVEDILVEGSGVGSGTDLVISTITWTLAGNFENLTLAGGSINGTGNGGNNIITGNNFTNTLSGGSGGDDTLFGMGGNDSLIGGSGNDTLDGGTGADTMTGGNGNDLYVVDNTADVIVGGSGIDTIQSSATFTLGTNTENLYLTGSSTINGTGNTLANIITGNSGFNTLSGGSGDDTLTSGSGGSYLDGGDGNDTLTGGAGLDTLHGGLGTDIFIFQNATAFNARDVVHDFNTGQGDKIDLRDVLTGYDPMTMNITDFVKIDNALNGTDSIMSVDQDGTGSGSTWTQIALITGLQGLDVNTLITNGNLIVH